ncbi:MAG: ATP-binding protein [Polyangiaceae bacterium]
MLTLYYNQIKQGVELVRRFDDPGIVHGRHEELNQVWTNLVHNGLQALECKGRLEVEVRREGERVLVEIVDSGPGIPSAVQQRMFEPFFTTKPQGERSGLGLSISHDIVARHSGSIEVDSWPGRTCFRVALQGRGAGPPLAESCVRRGRDREASRSTGRTPSHPSGSAPRDGTSSGSGDRTRANTQGRSRQPSPGPGHGAE